MNIQYEWKIDFTIIFTILGVIGSFIYTYISNKKNSRNAELTVLSEIFADVLYCLESPLRYKKNIIKYHNENKIIEQIVRRKLEEHDYELDLIYRYWKHEPEIQHLPIDEQQKILKIANDECVRVIEERFAFENMILSPAFYCDVDEVYEKLEHIRKHMSINSFVFGKHIRSSINRVIENDPKVVMEKYKMQLSYDPEYFFYNEPQFNDPYRFFLLLLRRRYDWLLMTFIEKLKEILNQFWYSKWKFKFRRNKWIYTGPIV